MFAAIAGEKADGHDFAAGAVAAGAVVVLATRPVGVPAIFVVDVTAALGMLAKDVVRHAAGATAVGITGSSGKTTTKDMLAQVLERHGPTVATARSMNTEIGLPLTVLRADEATRYLVLEMGARGAGHIAYLTGLVPPAAGLVLNVGTAHLGEFGSRAAIAQAKGEPVEALPAGGAGGLAALNADDDLVAPMAARASEICGMHVEDLDLRPDDEHARVHGKASRNLRFFCEAPGGCIPPGRSRAQSAKD